MRKHDWKAGVLLVLALLCIAGLGCSQYADMVTPIVVTPEVENYAGYELPQWAGFTTLHFFKQADRAADLYHRDMQLELRRYMQDDKIEYADLKNVTTPRIEQAEALQGMVIGAGDQVTSMIPGGGLLTLGLGLFGGGALGRKVKRPGDKSQAEVDEIVAKERASNASV